MNIIRMLIQCRLRTKVQSTVCTIEPFDISRVPVLSVLVQLGHGPECHLTVRTIKRLLIRVQSLMHCLQVDRKEPLLTVLTGKLFLLVKVPPAVQLHALQSRKSHATDVAFYFTRRLVLVLFHVHLVQRLVRYLPATDLTCLRGVPLASVALVGVLRDAVRALALKLAALLCDTGKGAVAMVDEDVIH